MNLTKQDLFSQQKQIKALLDGDQAKTDRFMATAYQASQNNNISKCSGQSILNAIVQTAQLNLSIDKNVGQAYIVPFKGNATLQIGYRGWIALLKRFCYDVKAFVVYECDEFSFEINGWNDALKFKPNFDDREDDSFQWVYEHMIGVFTMIRDAKTGEVFNDFTSKALIEKLRLSGPAQNGSPSGVWKDWYSEMSMAKAIKRHAKKMPLEEGMQISLVEDDLREAGKIEIVQDKEEKDLNQILLEQNQQESEEQFASAGGNKLYNQETGEIIDADKKPEEIDNRTELRKALIKIGAERKRAFEIEKELSDAEVDQYLSDPASIEALISF